MQAIEKIGDYNNWITVILLFLFLSIVLLKILNAKRLKQNFFAFFDFSLIEDEDTEGINFFDTFQIIIFLFSVTTLSLLTYRFLDDKGVRISDGFSSYSSIFIILLVYFVVKGMLEFGLSFLFLIREGVRFFMISKSKYLYSLSFLLYIAFVLCEYAGVNHLFAYYLAGFLFVARFVSYSIRNKKLIFSKLFYFILYICAFEIAPLFVLFKLIF
ncbi:DUF4271 domain-containing protein [Polaribacter sp. IC066]|uniref:DUF4271 domain-containing protein n=1 Tax=Polaribacter sp. IC066 TaxID=57032 RepID=UPI0011BDE771|nr:DUF4271 domain-containing protein [Polaribacter sp. IC066]TXD53560.1 DUF4271 domain-containing protein [Polaribacter sp. IC063]TXD57730.1 DUF4271 domain-containing protein [Polaribacter sp. IC066]